MLVRTWVRVAVPWSVVLLAFACAQTHEPAPEGESQTPNAANSASQVSSTVSRDVVRTAELHLVSPDPAAAGERLEQLAANSGGFVGTIQSDDGRGDLRCLKLTLQVPAERFQAVLSSVRKLGEVTNESVETEDVTNQRVDIDARMRSQQQLESRLLQLTQREGSLEDLLRIEQELTRVRTAIETLMAQSTGLSRRVAMSSVVVLVERPLVNDYAAEVVSRLERALDDALELSVMVAVGVVRLSGLVPLAVMLLGLWWIARRRVRKSITA